MDPLAHRALTRPGNVVFPANRPFVEDLEAHGGFVVRQPSGHFVFYGPEGRRFLATDPEGNVLHECEWETSTPGQATLLRVRLHLDWDGWVGLKPRGIVHTATLDCSSKPGWERLGSEDLRLMAAQALHLPVSEVQFFYGDADLALNDQGIVTIRQQKDAYYVLEDGTFEQARFMACMAAMRWERLDFLPVVELFQSLLPGTGTATFELIRGLYDDQNPITPVPLRYRGLPPYPSEAAFRLFSAFFTPQVSGGGDPFVLFMDPSRSHQVTWLPDPAPPLRYFNTTHKLCVTVKAGRVLKVVKQDDPTGLPFVAPEAGKPLPFQRLVTVTQGMLRLHDHNTTTAIPIPTTWGPIRETPPSLLDKGAWPKFPHWQRLFAGSLPTVTAREAFSAVLLYPDTEAEISEVASHPFVADYLEDRFEEDPGLAAHLTYARHVLIDNFDGAIKALVHLDQPRHHTILYGRAAYAQKHAQLVWSELGGLRPHEVVESVVFLPDSQRLDAYRSSYDLLFVWIPFLAFDDVTLLEDWVRRGVGAMAPGGLAFIVGPRSLMAILRTQSSVELTHRELVESLPTFRMHRTILPKARLKDGVTLFWLARR